MLVGAGAGEQLRGRRRVDRTRSGVDRRPAAGEDPLRRWREISERRMPHYRDLACWTVDSDGSPPAAVARRIHDLILEREAKVSP